MERETKTTPAVEVWLPVVGWEGLYEVSSHGRVRSIDRVHIQPSIQGGYQDHLYSGRILKQRISKGYLRVNLWKNNSMKSTSVHRLVAEAFIPNPRNLPEVNHKDENPINNNALNLEWCDSRYNKNYGTANKRRAHKNKKPIEQLTKDLVHVACYNSIKEACRANKDFAYGTNIRRALKKGICAYGYRWRYVDN